MDCTENVVKINIVQGFFTKNSEHCCSEKHEMKRRLSAMQGGKYQFGSIRGEISLDDGDSSWKAWIRTWRRRRYAFLDGFYGLVLIVRDLDRTIGRLGTAFCLDIEFFSIWSTDHRGKYIRLFSLETISESWVPVGILLITHDGRIISSITRESWALNHRKYQKKYRERCNGLYPFHRWSLRPYRVSFVAMYHTFQKKHNYYNI